MLGSKINIGSPFKPKSALPTLNSIPKPDIMLNLEHMLVPVHRSRLLKCRFICESLCEKKIISINSAINVNYRSNISRRRALQYMKVDDLSGDIQEKIVENIKDHDVFSMLELAYTYQLERLAKICLEYLQIQQFQQIKYQQYSLYETDFRLFQIILRRHHILKLKKQITGQPLQVVQNIINNYCRRNFYQQNIKAQLLNKYVNSWKKQANDSKTPKVSASNDISIHKQQISPSNIGKEQSAKSSLRMPKLSMKGIGQSTTIYGDDSQKIYKQQLINTRMSQHHSPKGFKQYKKNKLGAKEHQFNQVYSDKNVDSPSSKHGSVQKRQFSVQIQKQLQSLGFNFNFSARENRARVKNNFNIMSTVQTQLYPFPIAIQEQQCEKSSSKKQKDKQKQPGSSIINQRLKRVYSLPNNQNIYQSNKLTTKKQAIQPNKHAPPQPQPPTPTPTHPPKSDQQQLLTQIQLLHTNKHLQHKSYQLLLQQGKLPQTRSMIFQEVIEEQMEQSADFNKMQKKNCTNGHVNVHKKLFLNRRQPRLSQLGHGCGYGHIGDPDGDDFGGW